MSTPAFLLLPQPRCLQRRDGVHTPRPGGWLALRSPQVGELLGPAALAGEALRHAGFDYPPAADGGEGGPAAVLEINRALVSQTEGYRLEILPGQIRLTAHDRAGAWHAAVTLRQLLRQTPAATLPCLRIDDRPDFPQRGIMLDISRDKVPTMDCLFGLVELMVELKLNQLQLYTEHTFAYRDHREVWEHASPMTAGEIMQLDAYCREREIELVPNQNCFGHLERWLKHPCYRPLAEAPNGFHFPWRFEPNPFSLCPLDPGSIQLVQGMLDELLPNFASRQFNAGCDETFDLGQGRSADACKAAAPGRVYLDFVLKLHRLARERGRTMQFWGDIILHHPELIPELPSDMVAMVWGYEADHPFATQCAAFAKSGLAFQVCPGTSSWNSLTGRTDNAIGNLRAAAEHGLAAGAVGYLITDWGDCGHWQPLAVSYLAYAYGAAVAWHGAGNRDLDVPAMLDRHVFQDAGGVLGRAAFNLGNSYLQTRSAMQNKTLAVAFLYDMTRNASDAEKVWGTITADGWKQAAVWITDALKPLANSRP
ncbi:MAG: family 20 glycosylhydrolase, partial [bacterium]